MAAKPTKLPSFPALLAADVDIEWIECEIAGNPSRFGLLPMDGSDKERYATMGMKLRLDPDGSRVMEGDLDQEKRSMHLVSRTLVDWSAWRKNGAEWQAFNAPDDPRQRRHFIEQHFRCSPDIWAWLVQNCLRVNGLTEEAEGN